MLAPNFISAEAKFGYIPGLDGLRAIAVLIVLIAHAGWYHIIPGGFGVTVFFFISGFLITRLLLAETDKDGQIGLKNFYIRRFLRLLPALFAMVLVSGAFFLVMGHGVKPWEALAAFTYTMNYHNVWLAFEGIPREGPWEHLWSLAVEEHFYLLFPLILILFRKHLGRAILACLAICIGALLWRLTAHYALNMPSEYTYAATEARLDSIVYGCLLSLMLHKTNTRQFLHRLIGWGPMIIAAGLFLFAFLYRDDSFRETFRYSLQGMALFISILNLYFWPRLRMAIGLLEFKPAKWVGRISYGLYLWHIPVMISVEKYLGYSLGSLEFVVLSFGLTFLLTTISFYYLEKPIVALRRKFGSHAKTKEKNPKTVSPSLVAE